MLLHNKAQSTAEYAILLALVVAVAAGILQLTLKSGVRAKQQQGITFLMNAGSGVGGLPPASGNMDLYTQEYSDTQVLGGTDYVDKSLQRQGGIVESYQKQKTKTSTISIEAINKTQ